MVRDRELEFGMLPDEKAPVADLGASPAAIRTHYDLGNDFYSRWLDKSLCYSAARWDTENDDLETAQRQKLDWHLDAAKVGKAARLLDVGCGWGALLSNALDRGAARIIGITPSNKQAGWIRQHHMSSRIQVIEETWQRSAFDKPIDAIISIGALEHFARPGLSPRQKIEAYVRFFNFCQGTLTANGRLSTQFIGWTEMPQESEDQFLPKILFPESNLPRVDEVLSAAAPQFDLVKLENRPEDYTRTLRAWLKHLRANQSALTKSYGSDVVREYVRGFQRFMLGFEAGTIGLYRVAWKVRSQHISRTVS